VAIDRTASPHAKLLGGFATQWSAARHVRLKHLHLDDALL
jgi:hypothetical protein